MRSTAEWEAALEGTTPVPWQVGATTDLGHFYVGAANPDVGGIIAETGHDDARLISLAPEAVAEVVRLRRELELRVRIWQKVAGKLENRGDKDGASQARHTVAVVTRILEGTHE